MLNKQNDVPPHDAKFGGWLAYLVTYVEGKTRLGPFSEVKTVDVWR
ncbi:MAG: hypothetical protein LBG05_06760 [Treponema sp.]|jgi:hypothetical protein|nr:hypothetical protein [Treponema sp.]